jgi:hypothetical protein
LRRNTSIAQGELEGGEALLVLPHTFSEEDFLGDHVLAQFSSLQEILSWPDRQI